ncbi:hypothetical protein F383_07868 [Gossypium arboreum]|uniref:Uncharacterized protein n=1 Tax=Gossypium arboreum TaxID=29729 RepID=A0A0B0NUV8_GOSAR|nr:hypothetical protein F383_07868 [Gossypium arboreum]
MSTKHTQTGNSTDYRLKIMTLGIQFNKGKT